MLPKMEKLVSGENAGRGIPRSILYTPSLQMEKLEDARRYDADLYLLDLEDSVPKDKKTQARALCTEFLARDDVKGASAVRINEMSSAEYIHDLAALFAAKHFPAFIFMTMVRSPVEVELFRAAAASAGHRPAVYITVETIEAVTAMDEIAAVSDGMILGSADLAATLGVDIRWNNMLRARQKMAYACARYGRGCIDTGSFVKDDLAVLTEEATLARELGFHGKGTVYPKHLPEINRLFRPSAEDIAAAKKVLSAAASSAEEVFVLDGNLIGPPFVKKAGKILEMHEMWERDFSSKN